MPSELSVSIRDDVAPEFGEREPVAIATPNSRIEQRIIEWLCQPLLVRIPASVRPNTISLVTHFIAWVTATLAVIAPLLPPLECSLALIGAGFGTLASMIGDCLDGMHARRTNQCSKLGEMMDHWLDAIIVPLTTVGITVALGMEPWAIAIVNVTAAMVYHGQLVLYHHTGKFVSPEPATGTEAQLGLSIGYVALAPIYYYVGRDHSWFDLLVAGIALLGIFVQMRCNGFYYVRLGKLISRHLLFVAMGTGWAVLYLLSAIDLYTFSFAVVITSFRISGTYVLFTLVKRSYDGNDLGVFAWIAAALLAHFLGGGLHIGPLPLEAALTYGACAYMITRNLLDVSRHYAELKPTAR
jgi:phosphatidylglycerophosphate synthase